MSSSPHRSSGPSSSCSWSPATRPTRNSITHGMKALTEHPEQRELLFGDFDAHSKGAMEEIVRWATPVIHFRRTATEDT